MPDALNPIAASARIDVTGKDKGILCKSSAFGSPGEGAWLVRYRNGKVREGWLGGTRLLPEKRIAAQLKRK